jgi:hypothetical protein
VDLLARFHNTDEGWEYFAQEADAAATKALADEGGQGPARPCLTDTRSRPPAAAAGTGKSGKGQSPRRVPTRPTWTSSPRSEPFGT